MGKDWYKPQVGGYRGTARRNTDVRRETATDTLRAMKLPGLSSERDLAQLNTYLWDLRNAITNWKIQGKRVAKDSLSSAQIAYRSVHGSCLVDPLDFTGDVFIDGTLGASGAICANSGFYTQSDISAAGDLSAHDIWAEKIIASIVVSAYNTADLSVGNDAKITGGLTAAVVSVTGNLTADQISGTHFYGASANLTSNLTAANISVTGNLTADSISAMVYTAASASFTGDVTVNTLSATSNITADQISGTAFTGGSAVLTNNLTADNISATGNLTASTVSGAYGLTAGNQQVTGATTISSNGILVLSGAGKQWQDLRVPLTTTKFAGASDPDFIAFPAGENTRAHLFDAAVEEEAFFTAQFPHNTWTESDIDAHVHWAPTTTNTGSAAWGLEFTIANVNQLFPALHTISAASAGAGVANTHQTCTLSVFNLSEFLGGITGHPSPILVGRVYRAAAEAQDTYNADAALLEIDFHYQIDGFGSDERENKSY